MDIVDILSARRVAGLSFSHLKFLGILSVWCPRVSKRFENLGIQVVRQIVLNSLSGLNRHKALLRIVRILVILIEMAN